MQIEGKHIWQVAAGDTDRRYVDLLLYWNVIINGPGECGPWPDCKTKLKRLGVSDRKIDDLRRFYEGMEPGEIVVLRLGTKEVYAVGEIAQIEPSYAWLDDFGDIDGWDLQHTRRVRWFWHQDGQAKSFNTPTLKWGDTVQLLGENPEVIEWLSGLSPNVESKDCVQLPESCKSGDRLEQLETSEISEFLYDQGISANSIDALVAKMSDLIRIAKWYKRTGSTPSEHETVAYLVTPLLRALGWTPQKMAVEWNRIDIALFNNMPREDANLEVTVEAKRKDSSCLSAKSQAKGYAEKSGREQCTRLVVTDGIRYGVYRRIGDREFPERPIAYLNLGRLIDSYPILGMEQRCFGAKEALLIMAADWNGTIPGHSEDHQVP